VTILLLIHQLAQELERLYYLLLLVLALNCQWQIAHWIKDIHQAEEEEGI
jgi:hypothetical protein